MITISRIGQAHVYGASNGGVTVTNWFGTGVDGDLHVTANETKTIDVDEDTGQILMNLQNLTIDKGGILTPSHRCNGMILLVRGDFTLNGTISMDKLAPFANSNETACSSQPWVRMLGDVTGGAGGNGGTPNEPDSTSYCGYGSDGNWCGGGWPGGGGVNVQRGYWGQLSWEVYTYSAGDGDRPRHGMSWPVESTPRGASKYGAGGSAYYYSAGSAVGGASPGGGGAFLHHNENSTYAQETVDGNAGDGYPGGAVWIYVKGKVTIGSSGKITANGGNGGDGGKSAYTSYGGGGGGGGGGIIALIHNGDYTNNGSLRANGGKGGTENGKSGSVGQIIVKTLDDVFLGLAQ